MLFNNANRYFYSIIITVVLDSAFRNWLNQCSYLQILVTILVFNSWNEIPANHDAIDLSNLWATKSSKYSWSDSYFYMSTIL